MNEFNITQIIGQLAQAIDQLADAIEAINNSNPRWGMLQEARRRMRQATDMYDGYMDEACQEDLPPA